MEKRVFVLCIYVKSQAYSKNKSNDNYYNLKKYVYIHSQMNIYKIILVDQYKINLIIIIFP